MIEINKKRCREKCMFCTSKTDNVFEVKTDGFINRFIICDRCAKDMLVALKNIMKKEKNYE